MLKSQTKKIVSVQDWGDLVQETYGKPYNFQQQNGCRGRGTHHIAVPDIAEDYENDSITEEVNGKEEGVSFKAWLERDPLQELDTEDEWEREHGIALFWERNFYPDIQMLANDMHSKGLIETGEYVIEIDW